MNKFTKKLTLLMLVLCSVLTLGLFAACGEAAEAYSVTAEFDETQGTITLSAPDAEGGKYQKDTSVTATVTPEDGFAVATFTVNGTAQTLDDAGKYTFKVTGDTVVKATFTAKAPTYTVTLTKNFTSEMGTAEFSPTADANGKYEKDTMVTLTVTVNEGYELDSITRGDESIELEQGKYTFKVSEDTEITVTMHKILYYALTINTTVPGDAEAEGGAVTVTPKANTDGKYKENTAITLTVIPDDTHNLGEVKVNGQTLEPTDGKYKFNITQDTTVDVTFTTAELHTLTLTAEHCDLVYATSKDGQSQDVKIEPGATKFKEGLVLKCKTHADEGYTITAVKVDDVPVEDTASFEITMDADKTVVIETEWTLQQLENMEGTYTLGTETWYYFEGLEAGAYELTADTYSAYVVFYKVDGKPATEPKTNPEDPSKNPSYVFQDLKYDVHYFEAGNYAVKMSGAGSDGDGAGSGVKTTLTITKVTALGFTFEARYQGTWKSIDEKYSLRIGANYLVLLQQDAQTKEYGKVTATVAQNGDTSTYTLTFDQTEYQLMIPALGIVGLSKNGMEADILFVPARMPEPPIVPPAALYGTYAAQDGSSSTDKQLRIAKETGITWGTDRAYLLAELQLNSVGSYTGLMVNGKLYSIGAQQMNENKYEITIMAIDQSEDYMYAIPEDAPPAPTVTIDQKYWGKWECTRAGAALYEYVLEISEHNIVVTHNGDSVEATIGTHTYRSVDYPAFTIAGVQYWCYSVNVKVSPSSLTVYAGDSFTNSIPFVQVIAE